MTVRNWLVVLAGILLGSVLIAQDFSDVEITAIKVAGNVYVLEGRGGNIGVSAGPDGVLIVDDQFAPLADKIRAALKAINPGELKFVLNTHWHGDHTGGNEVFGAEAPIIAHDNVRKRLSTEQQLFDRAVPAAPPEAWPVITFDESVSIHFNGEEIEVIHFPSGHTDGDSVIFFTGSNVVHMGDDFFKDRFPFVDLSSGGSVTGLLKNIGMVIERLPDDVRVIPGHGSLATLDDLKRYHQMLQETVTLVRQKMELGQSLDEIKQEGVPDEWSEWGSGFISADRWLEIVYRSLESGR